MTLSARRLSSTQKAFVSDADQRSSWTVKSAARERTCIMCCQLGGSSLANAFRKSTRRVLYDTTRHAAILQQAVV